MYLYYHSDIIPDVTMAFTMHNDDIAGVANTFDALATHRLENIKLSEAKDSLLDTPIKQIGQTIRGCLAKNQEAFGKSIQDLGIASYQPENWKDESSRKLLLSLCSKGRFIPFILALSSEDIKKIKQGDMLYILAGFGNQPDYNFVTVMISLKDMINSLNMADDTEENQIRVVYPIMMDLTTGVMGSVLDANVLTMHSYIQKLEVNTEETTDA